MIVLFIVAILAALVFLGALFTVFATKNKGAAGITAFIALVIAVGSFIGSTTYTQGNGEARVISSYGKVVNTNVTPGWASKAPWETATDFDLTSQELVYAGGEKSPDYTGGKVNGQQVTVSVNGGTQANVDMTALYSIDPNPELIADIYREFKSQEAFTRQVVDKTLLQVARQAPSSLTPAELRAQQSEVAQIITDKANEILNPQGVTINFVSIQDIRFSERVQVALENGQVSAQNLENAKADQETERVKAETNKIKSSAITPELLQQQENEWKLKAAENGNLIIVGEGAATPLIQVPTPSQPAE